VTKRAPQYGGRKPGSGYFVCTCGAGMLKMPHRDVSTCPKCNTFADHWGSRGEDAGFRWVPAHAIEKLVGSCPRCNHCIEIACMAMFGKVKANNANGTCDHCRTKINVRVRQDRTVEVTARNDDNAI
jgi:hypothetical protein